MLSIQKLKTSKEDNPDGERAEERVMVDCSDSFVPVAQGQVWPGGFLAGCCFHLSFDNFNAMTALSGAQHCYHGHRQCATQKSFFGKLDKT